MLVFSQTDVMGNFEIHTQFDKKESMKVFKILLLIILVGLIYTIIYFYFAFKNTTWGGWKPPSTELQLNQRELTWKKQVRDNYDCEVDFIGLDNGYTEDSIIYINIIYRDNLKLQKILYDSIESFTSKLSNSFIVNTKRKKKYLKFTYDHIHNFNLDTVIKKFPSRISCLFDIKNNHSSPTEKYLIFTQFHYLKLDTITNSMSLYKSIGMHKYYYIKNYTNQKEIKSKYIVTNNFKYKGIENCESYVEKSFNKFVNNGNIIEYKFTYIFFENVCISTLINYKITPANKEYKYKNLVQYLTKTKISENLKTKKIDSFIKNYLNPNYLKYEVKSHGVLIKSETDTTKLPWTISYETSLDKIEFYSDMIK